MLSLRSLKILLITLMVSSVLPGCSPSIDMRGNKPLPNYLSAIKPGQQMTKSDVVALIGTPATASPFDDQHWYYISSKFESYAFYNPKELERDVIVIDFDAKGFVIAVRDLSLKDKEDVDMVARETPTQGKDLSILAQLLGNVGRYNQSLKDKKNKL